jgi:hypothetical protein
VDDGGSIVFTPIYDSAGSLGPEFQAAPVVESVHGIGRGEYVSIGG